MNLYILLYLYCTVLAMAHHDSVINAFIQVGLRQKQLQKVLASNVVLDWFGRTVSGNQKVVDFYLNSCNTHEHHLTNVEVSQPFECRSSHMLTRKEPEENFDKSIDASSSDDQWYDCDAHTSIDLKESHKTPPKKSTIIECPPAPFRKSLVNNSSSDEDMGVISDEDDGTELGIYPLDSSFEMSFMQQKKEKKSKKQKLSQDEDEKTVETTIVCSDQMSLDRESKFSNLYYLESTGVVVINKQVSSSRPEEGDRRECKVSISYRVNKDDNNDIQIALIVYKSSNSNQKSRRNLLNEFHDEISETETSLLALTPTISRFSTVVKEKPKNYDNKYEVKTDPAGKKSVKGTKRPIMSRNCLRF